VKENTVLNTVTATVDQPPVTPTSLAACDEFGPITCGPGLFSHGVVPLILDERDDLGRRLDRFVPDSDLL
jgi:hypothetical protein